jgi:Rod binding domain-containing protein
MNFAISATPPAATEPSASLEHRKLTEAAQQFEGMLLQEMLKPMQHSGLAKPDDQGSDGTDESAGDTLGSYGVETMATAIAKAGGLGIAKRIVTQVEAEKTSHSKSAEAAAQIPKQNPPAVLKFSQPAPMN